MTEAGRAFVRWKWEISWEIILGDMELFYIFIPQEAQLGVRKEETGCVNIPRAGGNE
jgi:hypothetical protein